MDETIYLWIKQSESVRAPGVFVGTVARVYCINHKVEEQVKKIPIYEFSKGGTTSIAVSVMLLVALIQSQYPQSTIELLGNDACVIYYKYSSPERVAFKIAYFLLIVAVVFFGAAFSIMSFNTDADIYGLLVSVQDLFVGKKSGKPYVAMIAYSVGLLFGMMLFFNHGFFGKKNKEPTPLQVQMRMYERDVNDAVLLDASRKGEMRDVD